LVDLADCSVCSDCAACVVLRGGGRVDPGKVASMGAGRRHRRGVGGESIAGLALLLGMCAAARGGPPLDDPNESDLPAIPVIRAESKRLTNDSVSTDSPEPPSAAGTLVTAAQAPVSPPGMLPPPTMLPGTAPIPGAMAVEGVPLDPGTLDRILRGGGGCASGGCASCGSGGCDSCGGSAHCHPGKKGCEPFPNDTFVGRLVGGLYEGVCCPDPCYVPHWSGLMNSAFFVDSPRPVTQSMFLWDGGWNLHTPDRAEYFWARADGKGRGPKPNGFYKTATNVNYDDLVMYTEAARGSFSMFFETTYRSQEADGAGGGAGFGDMVIGTKSLLCDSDMFLLAFQFKTTLPIGSAGSGVGPGHVSLEPSIIAAVRVTCDTAIQAQLAEWCPIGGDPTYAGAILRYGISLNHILWRPVTNVQLIGTAELSGLAFQDGAYTNPFNGMPQHAAGAQYVSAGAGLRLLFCDKMDFGVGSEYALTNQHFAQELVRVEYRYRY
jgi:hypothetical protein